jgi:hypothetical protein
MSEREEHFNLGAGWPLAKDEVNPPRTRLFRAPVLSTSVYRIAFCLVAVAAMIAGLCLLWCWRQRLGDDPATASIGRPGEIEFNQFEASMFALAEVRRREGWSGKVTDASPEGFTYYVTVERQSGKHSGKREMRKMAVCSTTGKVWDYGDPDHDDLPESVR